MVACTVKTKLNAECNPRPNQWARIEGLVATPKGLAGIARLPDTKLP